MNNETNPLFDNALEKLISRKMMDLFIRVGLLAFLVVYCYQIFKPFIGLMLWVILAVALYPLNTLIAGKMGGKNGRAATSLVGVILLIVLIPTALLAFSFADSATDLVKHVKAGHCRCLRPPSRSRNGRW